MTTTTQPISMEYELPAIRRPRCGAQVTEPKLMAAWLMACDAEPVAGQRFTLRAEPTEWWDGIVTCVRPRARAAPGGCATPGRARPSAAKLDTVVTLDADPRAPARAGRGCTFEHSEKLRADGRSFAFKGAQLGWKRNIDERLRQLLAQAAA